MDMFEDQELFPDGEKEYYETYFLKIEELFAALRNRSLLLSPADYRLARSWFDRGIPLSCVLRGIRHAFYHMLEKGEQEDDVLSLNWCKWAVMNEWKEYKEVPVSAETDQAAQEPPQQSSADTMTALLESLHFDVQRSADQAKLDGEEALAAALGSVATRLTALMSQTEQPSQQLEENLHALDADMMRKALTSVSEAMQKKMARSVDRKLKPHLAAMSPDQQQQTRQSALAQRLRQELRLPRLSLHAL